MESLPYRPMLSLAEIAQYLGTSVTRLRELCNESSPLPIPIHTDELLSLASTRILIDRALQSKSHARKDRPHAHDRISLLLWLVGLHGKPRRSYDQSVEMEIKRIARLPEPMRTERALDMLIRLTDSKVVAEALYRLQRLPKTRLPQQAERMERKLRELVKV